MHSVRALTGEGEVFIVVAVKVHPLHAVISLQRGDAVGRDFHERAACVAEQHVAIADAAGDRSVDVEVDLSIVIEV